MPNHEEKLREEFRSIGSGSVRFMATRKEVSDFWLSRTIPKLSVREKIKDGIGEYQQELLIELTKLRELCSFGGKKGREYRTGLNDAIDIIIEDIQIENDSIDSALAMEDCTCQDGEACSGCPKPSGVDENTSDGYHTFKELYEFRKLYNAALFNEWASQGKYQVHKSKRHSTGEECFGGGCFVVMAQLPTGQISNHYELKDWGLFQCEEREKAADWDGHTAGDVARRIKKFLSSALGLEEQEECTCLEDNKLSQAVCSIHGRSGLEDKEDHENTI